MSVTAQFEEFAQSVHDLCNHISVRQDEDGPYIFALGLKETHTLQLRKIADRYVIELWYGPDSDSERVIGEPEFETAAAAFEVAREWLRKDAI